MKGLYTLFVFFILFLAGCKKEIDLPDPSLIRIFGEWRWISTLKEDTLLIIPATLGYEQTLEFQKNGVFKRYKNGKKEDRGRYQIKNELSFNGSEYFIIHFKNSTNSNLTNYPSRVFFITDDSLRLDENLINGDSHLFVRK
jgi:hypothetical protein